MSSTDFWERPFTDFHTFVIVPNITQTVTVKNITL